MEADAAVGNQRGITATVPEAESESERRRWLSGQSVHEEVGEEKKGEFFVYFAANFAQGARVDEAAADASTFFDFNCTVKALLQQSHETHVSLERDVVVDAGEEGHDVEKTLLPLGVRGV